MNEHRAAGMVVQGATLEGGYDLTGVNRCLLVYAPAHSRQQQDAESGKSPKKPGLNSGGRAAAGAVGPNP